MALLPFNVPDAIFQKQAPSRHSIRRWYNEYLARGSHEHRRGNGPPQISDTVKEKIRNTFQNYPMVSTRHVAIQVGVHHTPVWRFSQRELKLYPYKLQMSQELR